MYILQVDAWVFIYRAEVGGRGREGGHSSCVAYLGPSDH